MPQVGDNRPGCGYSVDLGVGKTEGDITRGKPGKGKIRELTILGNEICMGADSLFDSGLLERGQGIKSSSEYPIESHAVNLITGLGESLAQLIGGNSGSMVDLSIILGISIWHSLSPPKGGGQLFAALLGIIVFSFTLVLPKFGNLLL